MGQIEVYLWLKEQRKRNRLYYSVADVTTGLKAQGLSKGVLHGVRGDLLRLEFSGYLDVKMSLDLKQWARLWRLKEKYV